MTPITGNPVVHFEVGCKDLEKTTAFYTGLFGWAPTPVPMASLLNTLSPEGIQGHITALGHEPHRYVTFYIQVDDIIDSLGRIEKAGGKKLIGPVPLPDNKQFAWFTDPEGNMIGLVTR
jgi:predicted enzyme related to lactoylglutathione lyase